MSVSHDEVQDRLLVRLNTQDAHEYHFWLTRRMALRWLPAMRQSLIRLEAAQPGIAAPDGDAQQILVDIKRDTFLQNADFATPYVAQALRKPLGSAPLLITDVHMSLQSNGGLEVVLQQKDGEAVQSCHLNLQAPLVHGLIHLVQETMLKANWDTARPETAIDKQSQNKSTMYPAAFKH